MLAHLLLSKGDMNNSDIRNIIKTNNSDKFLEIILKMVDIPAVSNFLDGHSLLDKLSILKEYYPMEWIFACEKLRYTEQKRAISGEVSSDKIKSAIDEGKKVTLLIRHAERPPLDPSDTSFGELLPITERGHSAAVEFGVGLANILSPENTAFYASRTFRTIQTSYSILKGMKKVSCGACSCGDVAIDDVLGSESPFFGPLDERMALIAEGRYLERLNEYFRTGEQKGYNSLSASTESMEYALSRFHRKDTRLVVAVTHDINVAAFLAGRGVVAQFDDNSWPHYLDAAVIIDDFCGGREYAMLRYNVKSRLFSEEVLI